MILSLHNRVSYYFAMSIQQCLTKSLSYTETIWTDVILMDEVLKEAALPEFSLEVLIRNLYAIVFSH